jgi:hypothetical protein
MQQTPSYDGSGLVNLIASIESHLTGSATAPLMNDASFLDSAETAVLVLFDGLGTAQLEHPAASLFKSSTVSTITCGYPAMTNVSLSTIATGMTPGLHGQVAHLTWFPDLEMVVNTLKWVSLTGEPVIYDYAAVLPRPNFWERLRASGVEPITVQPGDFQMSPLSRQLYRGARFEGAWDVEDLAEATIGLAEPGRLIFTYVPFVDVAGHVFGLGSEEFTDAMRVASGVWEALSAGLPPSVALIGTADHGLVDVAESDKIYIRGDALDGMRFAGDPRAVQLWGSESAMVDLADLVGGELVDPLPLLGPSVSDEAASRVGQRVLLAPPGKAVLPPAFDKRLKAYHGGISPEEIEIPLLIG